MLHGGSGEHSRLAEKRDAGRGDRRRDARCSYGPGQGREGDQQLGSAPIVQPQEEAADSCSCVSGREGFLLAAAL